MKVIKNVSYLIILFTLIGLVSCKSDEDIDPFAALQKEQEAIDQYIAENSLTTLSDTLGYNLKYVLVEQGTGDKPLLTDVIHVSYKGTVLSTGAQFDASDSAYFKLNSLIVGWQILLPHLREGGSMIMFLPSLYAYGAGGIGDIPGGEPLIFEVSLKSVVRQLDFEQNQIDAYIAKNELVAEVDSLYGLKYIIDPQGEGASPGASSLINVDYQGKFLNGQEFDKNNGVDFNLNGLIEGWRILMPYVKEGGTITMFIPSKYGYGSTGNNSIPGNTPLVFTVKLNTVK